MDKKLLKDVLKNEIAPLLIGIRNDIKDNKATKGGPVVLQLSHNGKELPEIKMQDGKTPVKGKDYFTAKEIERFLKAVTPKKGKDYFTKKEIREIAKIAKPILNKDYFIEDGKTPVKGKDYFTEKEITDFLLKVTPIKGVHYKDGAPGEPGKPGRDGTAISAIEVRDKLESLTGRDRLSMRAIRGLEEELKNLGSMKAERVGGMPIGMGATLNPSGVIAGSYTNANITVDEFGRVTVATNGSSGGVTSVFGRTGAITAQSGDYTTSLVTEGSNLYFTEARVRSTVLTGLSISGSSILSTDSTLTAFGKLQNQINTVIGGVNYQGSWNASTNNPSLASGVGTKGYYYVVTVPGSTNLDGITDWKLGDWVIFNGTAWQKVDNTDAVISVNGYMGTVVLTTSDIAEGTNLYYTDARARTAVSGAYTAGAIPFGNGTNFSIDASNLSWNNTDKTHKVGASNFTFAFNDQYAYGAIKTVPTFFAAFQGQNLSNSTTASTDIILSNNAGTETTNYLDIGIASSTNTDPLYTGLGANGAYIYNATGELAIGTNSNQPIKFLTGGLLTANIRGVMTGTGLFGWGTTNPDRLFDVTATGSAIIGRSSGTTNATAVYGFNTGTTGTHYGVIGQHVASGNLSIGTSGVANGMSINNIGLHGFATAGTNNIQLLLGQSVSAITGQWGIYNSNSSNNYFAGTIGIGTTTPFSSMLGVAPGIDIGVFNTAGSEGNLMVRGYASLGGTSRVSYGAVGSNYYLDTAGALRRRFNDSVSILDFSAGGFYFRTAGNGTVGSTITTTELARMLANGNFLIGGTTDGGFKLDVTGTFRSSGTATIGGNIALTGGVKINFATGGGFIEGADTYLRFATNAGTERMRIDSAGNVGIGTATPTFRLQVEESINGNGGMFVRNSNTGTNTIAAINVAANTGNTSLRTYSSTHSVFPLTGGFFTDSFLTGGMLIFNGANAPTMFYTNSSERMRITSGGDVGIGTTAPNTQLEATNWITSRTGLGAGATTWSAGAPLNGWRITMSGPAAQYNVHSGLGGSHVFITNSVARLTVADTLMTSTIGASITDTALAASGSLAGSVLSMTQTWNTTGNPTAINLNITNTASGATALLMNLRVGGVSQVSFDKDGKLSLADGTNKSTGQATLSSGTVTVSNTEVTANSKIYYSVVSVNGSTTIGNLITSAKVAGTSFTITSVKHNNPSTTETADNSIIDWWIIN